MHEKNRKPGGENAMEVPACRKGPQNERSRNEPHHIPGGFGLQETHIRKVTTITQHRQAEARTGQVENRGQP